MSIRLTDTSYGVLGLVEMTEPTTPYALKALAQGSVLHFWSIPHTQIYTECARLAEAGLLDETREDDGRRRRSYRLTAAGREALDTWRADPQAATYELRDPGLLKLFFSTGSPAALAADQLASHRALLAQFRAIAEQGGLPDGGPKLTLEAGIAVEAEYVRFWARVAGETDADAVADPAASASAADR